MVTHATDYRALRAKHPDVSASTIWRWAIAPKPHTLQWDEVGSESIGTATIDEWDIRATITNDDHVDASEAYGTLTMRYENGALENPYFREWHHPDYHEASGIYHDDICRSRHDDDGAARWYVSDSGDTLEELRSYYRQHLARHDAYSRALADFRRRADIARQVYADRYGTGPYALLLVDVTISLAGVDVASTGYGGCTFDRDYSKPLGPQLDAIVDDAVREAIAEAPGLISRAVDRERDAGLDRLASAIALHNTFTTMAGRAWIGPADVTP
jgi:hypothetical protein